MTLSKSPTIWDGAYNDHRWRCLPGRRWQALAHHKALLGSSITIELTCCMTVRRETCRALHSLILSAKEIEDG